jgi:anaerobic magnesium-protoporphyrin IX monomethyl ester cyclase
MSDVDILFGQSYFLRFDPKLWEARQPYPPLGTLYAAAYARQRGFRAALFDAMLAESEKDWATALDRHNPQIACLFEDNFNYLSKMCLLRMREAALTMIQMAKTRGCIVVMCGADATDHAEFYLEQGADYVLLGEGEETLGELLDALTGRTRVNLKDIDGLAFVDRETGLAKFNRRRPDMRDLDGLPYPAWDLVDVERYRGIWLHRHGYYSANMVTTRGCPYSCNWCAKPIWGQRYNVRSAESVVGELKWLLASARPDHLWFADDIFGLKPGWLARFADLIEIDRLNIRFKCLLRADLVTETAAQDLARAGCTVVWLGAESGSERILAAMEKGCRVNDIYEATRRLHRAGIQVGFFLQFGYPGETWPDIQATLRMIRVCQPDDIGISVSYPLPGTKFYERVKTDMEGRKNWTDSQDLAMLYHGSYPTDFYRVLHGRVHHEFRFRRALQRHSARALAEAGLHAVRWLISELRLRRWGTHANDISTTVA